MQRQRHKRGLTLEYYDRDIYNKEHGQATGLQDTKPLDATNLHPSNLHIHEAC